MIHIFPQNDQWCILIINTFFVSLCLLISLTSSIIFQYNGKVIIAGEVLWNLITFVWVVFSNLIVSLSGYVHLTGRGLHRFHAYMIINQWGFFSVPNLLWPGISVYIHAKWSHFKRESELSRIHKDLFARFLINFQVKILTMLCSVCDMLWSAACH